MPEVLEETKSESEVGENESTKSEPPTKRGRHFVDKLNAYRNIILAVAALATAVGSWFKPTDTTTVKQSFDWTTEKVQELSKNDVQMHEDIAALRAYLEGMKNSGSISTPLPSPAIPETGSTPESRSQGRSSGGARKPIRRQPTSGHLIVPESGPVQEIQGRFIENQNDIVEQFQIDSQEPAADSAPPELKADPHVMKRPSFDDITE